MKANTFWAECLCLLQGNRRVG